MISLRGGAAVARRLHAPKVGGAIPSLATTARAARVGTRPPCHGVLDAMPAGEASSEVVRIHRESPKKKLNIRASSKPTRAYTPREVSWNAVALALCAFIILAVLASCIAANDRTGDSTIPKELR